MPIKKTSKMLRGYTLMEVIVSISMFTIIMLAITQIFGNSFVAYRQTRSLQRNLESAQFAMNLMAKELRTSSIFKKPGEIEEPTPGLTKDFALRFIDYSQNGGKGVCIFYQYNRIGQHISKWAHPMTGDDPNVNRSDCKDHTFTGADAKGMIIENVVDARAYIIESTDTPTVGKVTISFQVGSSNNNKTIQTTVSLRDYNYTGI